MKRLSLTLSALAVLMAALIAAGCGSGGGGSSLGDALSFVPKDAPVVFAVKTDPEDEQYKNILAITKKFPGANQIEQRFKQGLNQSGADYEKDVKPLLGNDLVAAIPSAKDLNQEDTPAIVAIKVEDEDKAKELLKKGSKQVGEKDGAPLFQDNGGDISTVKDGVVVSASTRQLLDSAFAAKDGDHMSDGDFNDRLGELDKESLVRVAGDMQTILGASPEGGVARKVKWVGALRGFGLTMAAEKDGFAVDFAAKTEGELSDQDLPIASGDGAAPILRRGGEIGMGVRDIAQIVEFGQSAAKTANPSGAGQFDQQKQQLNQQLGIDIDKDLIAQFTGNSSMSFSLDGKYAVRSEVKDPEAFKGTLEKVADQLPKLLEGTGRKNVGLAKPKGGNDYYALATPDRETIIFGVVDKVFVVASDASRAGQAATQSPSPVAGAKGAVTMGADAEALVNSALRRIGNGSAAQAAAFTGPLGDMTGSMKADPGSLTANLKLKVE